MTYLKFAYLAEFAVAFNLAFGEFKQEKIAEVLDKKISDLDQKFDAPLNTLAKNASKKALEEGLSDFVEVKRSWYSECVIRFDNFRNYRKKTTEEYKPLPNFFQRIVLFASDPEYLKKKSWLDIRLGFPLRVWLSLPKGLLASWTYTKTKNWTYPPCRSSITLWAFVVFFSLLFLIEPGAAQAVTDFYSIKVVTPPISSHWIFFILGICVAVFSLRPLSFVGAKLIGRTPTPRARYYQMAMVFVVSLVVILLTWCEIVELPSPQVFERFSYFLLGLFIYAISLPLLLLMGHLLLETTVSNWTDWAAKTAQDAAQVAISKLPQAAAQSFTIEFDGYWREPNKGSVPEKSGIYCVFSCVYNVAEKTVTLKKLIYIGEADDARAAIANHGNLTDWNKQLMQDEILCYNFGFVHPTNRVRCEAAMIFKHKPPLNSAYKSAFPFDQTTITLAGKTNLLDTQFTVQRT